MAQELFSVDQVARLLKLHVRTVRSYVRDGRLRAVRIGKQYRIAREDLEAMTGAPLAQARRDVVSRERRIEVSSIVQLDAIAAEEAIRVTNWLVSAVNGRRERDELLRVQTIYDEERGALKVILIGGVRATARALELLNARLEASDEGPLPPRSGQTARAPRAS